MTEVVARCRMTTSCPPQFQRRGMVRRRPLRDAGNVLQARAEPKAVIPRPEPERHCASFSSALSPLQEMDP